MEISILLGWDTENSSVTKIAQGPFVYLFKCIFESTYLCPEAEEK